MRTLARHAVLLVVVLAGACGGNGQVETAADASAWPGAEDAQVGRDAAGAAADAGSEASPDAAAGSADAAPAADAGSPSSLDAGGATDASSGSLFGTTSLANASMISASVDYKRATGFPLAEGDVQVTVLTAGLDGNGETAGSQSVRGVIYDSDGASGGPGTLLCSSGAITIQAATAPAWFELTFAEPCVLPAAKTYYLGLHTGGPTAGLVRYTATNSPGSAGLFHNWDAFADGASSPFGASNAPQDTPLIIFARYVRRSADAVPPSAAVLALSAATASTITVSWSAPGDDGAAGTAARHELRYSTEPIDASSWAAAALVGGMPAPAAAGTAQTKTVSGLAAGTTYYFAMKAWDEAGNASSLSNVPSLSTLASPVTCDKVASRGGLDSNPGTEASPYKTAQKLYSSLQAGQTGCLRAGVYDETSSGYALLIGGTPNGASGAPITLRSFPGERATIRGLVEVRAAANHVTLSHLNFDVAPVTLSVGITVFGTDIVFEENDVSDGGTHICLSLGGSLTSYGIPQRAIVRKSKFHNCGVKGDPHCQDHAIYLAYSQDALIEDNLFIDTGAYAIHLYPAAQASIIRHNVMDRSGCGAVIFASGQEPGSTDRSNDNVFEKNIVTNSGYVGINHYWGPTAGPGTGNAARDNCLWGNARDLDLTNSGVAQSNNVVADPKYLDAAGGDYRLGAGSGCLSVVGQDTASMFDW